MAHRKDPLTTSDGNAMMSKWRVRSNSINTTAVESNSERDCCTIMKIFFHQHIKFYTILHSNASRSRLGCEVKESRTHFSTLPIREGVPSLRRTRDETWRRARDWRPWMYTTTIDSRCCLYESVISAPRPELRALPLLHSHPLLNNILMAYL